MKFLGATAATVTAIALNTGVHHGRSVWQLARLEIR